MDLQTEQRLLDDLRAIDQETLTGFSKSIDDFRASDQEVVHRLTCSNMANLCTLPAAAPASKGEDKRDAVQKMLVSICQKLTKIEQFQKSMQLSMERSQQQVLQKVDAVVERVQQSRESHMDLSFEHGNDTQSRLNDSDPNLHSHHCTRDLQSSIFAVPEVAGHKRKKRVSRAKSPMGYPAPEAGAEPQTAAFGHDLEPQSLASPATVTNLDSMTESTEDYEERQMKWWQVGVILPDCKFKQVCRFRTPRVLQHSIEYLAEGFSELWVLVWPKKNVNSCPIVHRARCACVRVCESIFQWHAGSRSGRGDSLYVHLGTGENASMHAECDIHVTPYGLACILLGCVAHKISIQDAVCVTVTKVFCHACFKERICACATCDSWLKDLMALFLNMAERPA